MFSQDTVANIRCAVKYAVWHTGYLLLSIVGLLLLGVVYAGKGLARIVPGETIGNAILAVGGAVGSAIGRASTAFNESVAKDIAEWAAIILLGVLFLAFVGMVLYQIWLTPFLALQVGVGIVLTIGVLLLLTEAYDRYAGQASESVGHGISKAKSRAVDTPGVRRIYGNCPVDFEISPLWFRKIDEKLEKVFE